MLESLEPESPPFTGIGFQRALLSGIFATSVFIYTEVTNGHLINPKLSPRKAQDLCRHVPLILQIYLGLTLETPKPSLSASDLRHYDPSIRKTRAFESLRHFGLAIATREELIKKEEPRSGRFRVHG
ncbi:unnamed protein product [Lactuca saligna]|uniref:Uncharacterized protein n=1 Tax=Lactuca saligna TaxID=75948 RepID=A0AA36EFU9_LACSI|nr:unnamed protein product [Lactuca saligna]